MQKLRGRILRRFFWVEEPRHSKHILDEKCYTSVVAVGRVKCGEMKLGKGCQEVPLLCGGIIRLRR